MTTEENKTFEEQKEQLFKQYGKVEGNQIVVDPENTPIVNEELTEMLLAEKEIDIKVFWGEANIVELIEQVETDEYYPVMYKLIGI